MTTCQLGCSDELAELLASQGHTGPLEDLSDAKIANAVIAALRAADSARPLSDDELPF